MHGTKYNLLQRRWMPVHVVQDDRDQWSESKIVVRQITSSRRTEYSIDWSRRACSLYFPLPLWSPPLYLKWCYQLANVIQYSSCRQSNESKPGKIQKFMWINISTDTWNSRQTIVWFAPNMVVPQNILPTSLFKCRYDIRFKLFQNLTKLKILPIHVNLL
jgi:hypothetical protein